MAQIPTPALAGHSQAQAAQTGPRGTKSAPRPRKIIVSSNCVTGGLTACLGRLLPDCEVLAIPAHSHEGEEQKQHLLAALRDADVWVTCGWLDLAAAFPKEELKVIRVPTLTFQAFHPDLTYAKRKSDGQLINAVEHYNSSIILWAWQHGLDESSTRKLFTPSLFEELGFLDAWEASERALRAAFESSDLDWRPFLLHAKRLGCFMYSINHPKLPVIMYMAGQIARVLDGGRAPEELPSTDAMEDALTQSIWPVYPPIADSYSLSGSYQWKAIGKLYRDIAAYIRHSFEIYQAEKVAPDDIHFGEFCGERFFRAMAGHLRSWR